MGGEIRSLSVRRSAGTSRVSRCLSAIKANELFHFVVSLVEKHLSPPPEAAIGLFMSRNRREREQLECQRSNYL